MTRSIIAALLGLTLLLAGCSGAKKAETDGPAEAEEKTTPAAQTEEPAALEVHFFDAGKADAILLTTAGSAVLVDAGEKGFGKTILAYLAEKGVEKLDCLIITHFDQDHVGGAAKILNNLPVERVLQSNHPKDSEEYEKYGKALKNAGLEAQTVRDELCFTLDGVTYTVNPPARADYEKDGSNNSSLAVTVQHGKQRFFLPGDAQTERLTELLAGTPEPCGVLKIPHHGKEEPLLAELLAAVQPRYAVITSSEEEPESEAAVQAVKAAGAEPLLTRAGAVTFFSDGSSLRMEQAEKTE